MVNFLEHRSANHSPYRSPFSPYSYHLTITCKGVTLTTALPISSLFSVTLDPTYAILPKEYLNPLYTPKLYLHKKVMVLRSTHFS